MNRQFSYFPLAINCNCPAILSDRYRYSISLLVDQHCLYLEPDFYPTLDALFFGTYLCAYLQIQSSFYATRFSNLSSYLSSPSFNIPSFSIVIALSSIISSLLPLAILSRLHTTTSTTQIYLIHVTNNRLLTWSI